MNVIEAFARQAVIQPRAPAIITNERTITYRSLAANVAQLAASLSKAGVGRRDVVAVVAPTFVQHVGLTMAIAQLGAVSLPLPPASRTGESEAIAAQCGVSFLVHTQGEGYHLAAPGIRKQMSLQSLNSGPHATTPSIAQAEPGEMWRIGLSSGTTGRPKPMAFSHESMVLRSHLMRAIFPCGPGDRMMVFLGASLQFAVGYWMRTLSSGGALVTSDLKPLAAMQAMRKHRVHFLLTSPGNAIALLKVAQAPQSPYAEPPPDLKMLCVGGSAVPPAVQEALRRHLCPHLAINYGVTEVGLLALADDETLRQDPTCAGRLVPWIDVQALGDDGHPLPPGQTGLLRMRSALMALGYVGADPEVARAFRDGWFHSSDIGSVASDGSVYLGGRTSDVLNLSGLKVDPARVEDAIAADPAVLECVALAAPIKSGECVLVAVVVASEQIDKNALKKRCKDKLGIAMVPKAVFQLDSLPHNEGGKVARDEVLKLIRHRPPAAPQPAAG